jgi:hypothetical protein|tara:strand:+ start:1330 stop:1788 length:459 start_codon:yes stop_codon:yes gene_type:complete
MAATTAFSTVKKFVNAGQEFEQVAGQLGKWYTAVSDFRHAQQDQKNPPLFKKLFSAGSVEEEALNLLIQEKKIMEQEKELSIILNMRFGPGTMDELKEMRRSIRKKREATIYKQLQRRKALVEVISVTILLGGTVVMLGSIFYFVAKAKGII